MPVEAGVASVELPVLPPSAIVAALAGAAVSEPWQMAALVERGAAMAVPASCSGWGLAAPVGGRQAGHMKAARLAGVVVAARMATSPATGVAGAA